MVSNQIDFNNQFPQESQEIEVRRQRNFNGSLMVSDYSKLKNLNLRDIKNIEQVTLQNLPLLSKVVIWSCGIKDLIIRKCPQLKLLIIRSNSLADLNFLIGLESLKELDVDGNPKLLEMLNPYKGNWKNYQKDIEEIFQLTKDENFQEIIKNFWNLKKSHEDLKKNIISLLKEKEEFSAVSKVINTKEIVFNLSQNFKEKEEKINYLELRAKELAKSSEEQKEKIINSFVKLIPEKELVQQLIANHLEFIRFKKQGVDSEDYEEKCDNYTSEIQNIKKKLRSKIKKEIVKETMNKIQSILSDFEELINQEIELENKLKVKSFLITDQKQVVTFNQEEKKIIIQNNEIHLKQLEELENIKKQNSLIIEEMKSFKMISQFNETTLIKKIISQLISKNYLNDEEIEIINETKNLLIKKRNFLMARKETIVELRSVCDSLEWALNKGKFAKIEEISKSLSIAGKIANQWTFGVIEALGEAACLSNFHHKRIFTIKQGKKFSFILKDEKEITELAQSHLFLKKIFYKTLIEEKEEVFSNDYHINEVITNIWENKAYIDISDMKGAIFLLVENLKLLKKELESQENLLENLTSKFNIENLNFLYFDSDREEKLQNEIREIKNQLEEKKDSFKIKLRSKNPFNGERVTEERGQLLQEFLNIQIKIIDNSINPISENSFLLRRNCQNIKEKLIRKLSAEELDEICLIQLKLIRLQKELESFQFEQEQKKIEFSEFMN